MRSKHTKLCFTAKCHYIGKKKYRYINENFLLLFSALNKSAFESISMNCIVLSVIWILTPLFSKLRARTGYVGVKKFPAHVNYCILCSACALLGCCGACLTHTLCNNSGLLIKTPLITSSQNWKCTRQAPLSWFSWCWVRTFAMSNWRTIWNTIHRTTVFCCRHVNVYGVIVLHSAWYCL